MAVNFVELEEKVAQLKQANEAVKTQKEVVEIVKKEQEQKIQEVESHIKSQKALYTGITDLAELKKVQTAVIELEQDKEALVLIGANLVQQEQDKITALLEQALQAHKESFECIREMDKKIVVQASLSTIKELSKTLESLASRINFTHASLLRDMLAQGMIERTVGSYVCDLGRFNLGHTLYLKTRDLESVLANFRYNAGI